MEGEATVETTKNIHERLLTIKKAVQKATLDAFRQQQVGPLVPEENDAKSNSSFHLGMELFGQDVADVEKNIQDKLSNLEQDLKETLQIQMSSSTNYELQDEENDDPMEVSRQAEILRAKIKFLKQCSEARALLDDSVTLSTPALAPNEETDLVQSAKKLVQAQQALQVCQRMVDQQESQSNSTNQAVVAATKVIDSIQHSIRQQKTDLLAHVRRLWQSTVVLTPYSLSVQSSHDGVLMVYDTLAAFMDDKTSSSTLDDMLRSFTRTLYNDVLGPIIQSHSSERGPKTGWVFQESETRAPISTVKATNVPHKLSKGPFLVLEWSREEDITGSKPDVHPISPWKDTFEFIGKILTFVSKHIIAGREQQEEWFRERLFGKPKAVPPLMDLEEYGIANTRFGDDDGIIVEPLTDMLLDTCVPKYLDSEEIKELGEMAEELKSFVGSFLEALSGMKLVPTQNRLSSFVENFEEQYASGRRSQILGKARKLLLESDYHNARQIGDERQKDPVLEKFGVDDGLDVFYLQRAAVSETAIGLLELCRETMVEAVSLPYFPVDSPLNSLAVSLFKTARDTLDLFRALIPARLNDEIKNVPRTSAIFHNDNVFLAYHCLVLGREFKDDFPQADPNDKSAQLLRKYCMFVDMAPLFREHADKPFRDMLTKQAIQIHELVEPRICLLGQSLRSRESLAEWTDAETAVDAGAYHLNHLKHTWKPVLSKDIFSKSMSYLADELQDLFLRQVLGSSSISQIACSFIRTLFEKIANSTSNLLDNKLGHSKHHERICTVSKIMGMTIMEFESCLSDGTFHSMTNQELKKLLLAAFQESPKRSEIVRVLSSQ